MGGIGHGSNPREYPERFKKFVCVRILKRLIPFIILEVALTVVLTLWGKTIYSVDDNAIRYSLYIITLLVPCLIMGIPQKLIDKTYFGTVDSVSVRFTTDNASLATAKLYTKHTVILTIILPDGKKENKTVFSGKISSQSQLEEYKKGDMIFHLYGTKHTVVLPDGSDTHVNCVVCNYKNDVNESQCSCCKHSLIKKPKF